MRNGWVRLVAGVASVAIAVALLVLALPAITGVPWSAIRAEVGALSASTLLWLALLWLAGLWTYTFVLTSSLPGLRHAQAFVLNCAGSAISNVLPFGGAAGVAVTFAMAGSWGHTKRAITVSTVVSGAWNLLSRLSLPALGLGILVLSGYMPDRALTVAATVATVLLGCTVALLVAVLLVDGEHRSVAWIAHRLRPTGHSPAAGWLRRSPWVGRAGDALRKLRQGTADVVRRGWRGLTLGMVGYLGMQYLLFWACLAATATPVSVGATVAAFALSRILASSSVTPGGIGVTESGTAALLMALGVPGAPAAAALLLFGFFTHALEIPVGAFAWLTWAGMRRWRVGQPVASVDVDPSGGLADSAQ